jgi:hypothetical protein
MLLLAFENHSQGLVRATDCSLMFATLIQAEKQCELGTAADMKFRMTKVLRFWVDVEYERTKNRRSGRPRTELTARILRKFEEAGEAMRYLTKTGEIAWKATPGMLMRLADAEQEARDDLADW